MANFSKGKIAIPNVTGNIVISVEAVQSAAPYTNLADPTSADWKTGYRLTSAGAPEARSGKTVCNFIPAAAGDTVYFKGITSFETASTDRIACYDANKADLSSATMYSSEWLARTASSDRGYMEKLGENYFALHLKAYSGGTAAYIRASFTTPADAGDIIITVNQEINGGEG